jgi:hypothetical protein
MAAARSPEETTIMRAILASLALLTVALPAHAAPVSDDQAVAMAKPQTLIVSPGLKPTARRALLRPVDQFYGFWINGSAKLLAAAISPNFVDHTLPAGRPQGRPGPPSPPKAFWARCPIWR